MDFRWDNINYDDVIPTSQNADLLFTMLLLEIWGLPPTQIVEESPFERDPDGDINLRAFAQDRENVQRATIQSASQTKLAYLVEQPIHEDQKTIQEIFSTFLSKYGEGCADVLFQLEDDIQYIQSSFGFSYSVVLDHVWAIIRTHEHKQELIQRLYEELSDGIDACYNGKMCRLMNVLQGFDDRIVSNVSKDAFQSKMASFTKLSKDDRLDAAKQAMDEYGIPESEREPWFAALFEE